MFVAAPAHQQFQQPGESFDAVICVFGIFFVPDMSSAVRELWHFVRPRGKAGDHDLGI
jgi:ubiquinone/menaquinone biosynthesis C-methylase UbiE